MSSHPDTLTDPRWHRSHALALYAMYEDIIDKIDIRMMRAMEASSGSRFLASTRLKSISLEGFEYGQLCGDRDMLMRQIQMACAMATMLEVTADGA